MSKRYTEKHEWIEVAGENFRVGISDYAQEQLGDVVMIELPDIGKTVAAGEECAVIESVKAASDIYSPVGGEVTAVNEALNDNPALVNEEPEAGGWLYELKISDAAELDGLMDAAAYAKFVEESDE